MLLLAVEMGYFGMRGTLADEVPVPLPALLTTEIPATTEESPNVSDAIPPELAMQGIRELIGSATTDYTGSAAARTYNIAHAAKLLDGTVIPVGQEFSFVRALGNPDGVHGFQKGMVIQGGKMLPEYGGGVCQVSTTIFRAALKAGLPIVQQKPHSLKLKYYNPPGLDATIYPGVVDMRFGNDTGHAVLLRARVVGNGQQLQVDLYGARDGRTAVVSGPYYPDGTLITDMSAAGLSMYWQRESMSADGAARVEKYVARYTGEE